MAQLDECVLHNFEQTASDQNSIYMKEARSLHYKHTYRWGIFHYFICPEMILKHGPRVAEELPVTCQSLP